MKNILPFLFFFVASTTLFGQRDSLSKENVQTALTGFLPIATILSGPVVNQEVITIPVVVHVLYNTADQNISDAQIQSQIDVLNKDFSASNADLNKVPAYFAPYTADAGFKFELARVDPRGYTTNGIVRKHTSIQLFGTDERVKYSAKGGDDAWDRKQYLNIWVCSTAGGIVGYASTGSGLPENDGVVIRYTAFGTMGTVAPPFNFGRTATHEIGHWLNLRHIWGDEYCGDDGVDDTPKQRSANRGCPEGKKYTCGTTAHGDMYMNFMDLTNDACMFMFTKGQVKRMRALFVAGGFRSAMLSSHALSGTLIPAPVEFKNDQAALHQDVKVYPNPASDVVTLEITGFENDTKRSLTVYNHIGQPVITQAINTNRTVVNISYLKPGIYFVKWADGNAKFVKK